MAENIGPKIGIEGEAAFKQSLKNIVQQTKALDAEFKMVTSTFGKNSDAQAKLKAQAEVLGRQMANQKSRVTLLETAYENSKKKLDELSAALNKATNEHGKNSTEAQAANAAYQRQIGVVAKAKTEWMNATTAANKMADQLADTEDALSKAGQETQSTEEETKKLGAAMEDTGQKSSVFGDMLKANLLGDAIQAAIGKTVDMIKELGSAFVSLAKSSLEGYGNYEQLVGGVKTLFGTEAGSVEEYAQSVDKSVAEVVDKYNSLQRSQETVLKNARDSWKTTGLTINDYMETVTGFAASLISSLGGDTEKAARYADMALVDMSDNANKFGTDMTSIIYAYQGFAKQNYTMLDNLKLGYGGTKTEMERLVADAAALTDVQNKLGVTVDANSLSFENIVAAIHVVHANMGIMGTTAREAESTIQGSVNGMKAAWENFLTGMADPEQDFDALVQNLVQSIQTAASNIVPRLQEIIPTLIEGLGELVDQLSPYVGETIEELAPTIKEALLALVDTLQGVFAEAAPQIGEAARVLGDAAIDGITAALDELLAPVQEKINAILPTIAAIGAAFAAWNIVSIIAGVVSSLGGLSGAITAVFAVLAANPIGIVVAAIAALVAAIMTAWNTNDEWRESTIEVWGVIKEAVAGTINALVELIAAFGRSAWEGMKKAGKAMKDGLMDALTFMAELPGKFLKWGADMIQGLIDGIRGMLGNLKEVVTDVAGAIKSFLHFSRPDVGPLRNYEQWMPDFMAGLADGIDANSWRVEDAITRLTGRMGVQLTAAQTGGAIVNQTINFGYEVQAPDVVAREVRRITTSGLAGA